MSTPLYYKTDYNFPGTPTTTPPPSTDLGNSFVPVGTLLLYAGTNLPANYLWCDGSQYSTTTYSTLYSVIGNTYNLTSPSSGNFFVPDMRKKTPIGAQTPASMVIPYQGSNNVKSSGNSTLSVNQLAQHYHHPPTANGNNSTFVTGYESGTSATPGYRELDNANNSGYWINNKTGTATGGVSDSTGTNVNTGQEFLPPFTVVNYIIKYQ